MNEYQNFIHTSRYARWLENEGRRETWEETVDRYINNIVKPVLNSSDLSSRLANAIKRMDIMPSMRAMMTAGPAANRDNTCIYNCAYLPVDKTTAFAEAMFVLLNGTGVGYSVERQFIKELPDVPFLTEVNSLKVIVEDSKEGWADALNSLITHLYNGEVLDWDLSKIRPAGAKLKTFGGRASGPEPLDSLFKFTTNIFRNAEGRKLTSIECHDLMCKIADVVVVGGVRRSAMISLSNLSDDRMRHAKSGQWWDKHPYRALANNSAVYSEKPDSETFLREWLSLVESKSGERGIFNRQAAIEQVKRNGRRNPNYAFGTNPCSEIILRPRQFCNLTEVVCRSEDSVASLQEKVYLATVLGTVQATYTYFPYLEKLNSDWKTNTEEERLLGVSMTGILDCPLVSLEYSSDKPAPWQVLRNLKEVAVETNKRLSNKLKINQAAAITCVKPSGTVSQLVDSASGIHPRHSEYYIRTVRGDKKDPLTEFMVAKGFPHEDCHYNPNNTTVFSFPVASPKGSLTRSELNAIMHLELWQMYQEEWCEHKPSITVSVEDWEWVDVAQFVYENFDTMTGVAFLPYDGGSYIQAPYQGIDEDEYTRLLEKMPKDIDWTELRLYESGDHTKSSQTFACTGDVCEVVDI